MRQLSRMLKGVTEMERIELSDEVIGLGDAIAQTRGPSIPGQPDTDRPLNFVLGLSDED